MKQHPKVQSFAELVSHRDGQMRRLSGELNSLKNYMASVQKLIAQVNGLEQLYKKVLCAVDHYHFMAAAALLGTGPYCQVLLSAGIGADVSIQIPPEEQQFLLLDPDKAFEEIGMDQLSGRLQRLAPAMF